MSLREDIIAAATAEIGVKESPPDSNKVKYNTWIYGKEVQGSAYAWCGAFVSYCYFKAGATIKNAGLTNGYVGCQYAVTHLSKWGRLVTVPMPADIVFYDWQGDGKFDHTGIFVKDLGKGLFEAIEGNTAFGNDSNGGQVMRRADRKYKNAIFVRPFVLENEKIA